MSDDAASTPTQPPTLSPPRLRASDTDRHQTVSALQDAAARGLLTADEAGQRMATAYAARHLDELPGLTADLPPAPAPAPTAPGWRLLLTLAALQTRAAIATITADGLRSRRALAAMAAMLVAVAAIVALVVAGLHGLADPHGFDPGARR